jgi:hypothetical protein
MQPMAFRDEVDLPIEFKPGHRLRSYEERLAAMPHPEREALRWIAGRRKG